ncbi:carboxypeptidase-like regulatory domain-containing protein [Salinimicrobium sp. TH3]|uniref:carboxypeptidase-like regulatory domain-containing protein n=1 Tax=Salinimicrobium sp. TH3 TaxID=2997342 RepID=UPI00227456DC|nr:carboxypeptidase-like regulatory domain-containing protein [Salinimicrobium sp. TH3]MCY2686337.1 carboxypeptidase-like regulatory domain-containing protein [Salinimicrobium sp. TH3]
MKIFSFGRILFPLILFSVSAAFSQSLSGVVIDKVSGKPVYGVSVRLSNTTLEKFTDPDGIFIFSESLPQGEQILTLSKNGFLDKHFPIKIFSKDIDLGEIVLQLNLPEMQRQTEIISLADHELDEDGGFANISGLLQASKDVFLNAAAFDFSPTFFRPRGYDSEYGKVLINGLEMNKIFNGRPLWSNWGGLNDVQRNQEFSNSTTPSDVSFGGPAGTTNIIMRASQYQNGGKFSYAMANRSYSGRSMGSYHSGLLPSGWAYSLSLSRRYAKQSYMEGSSYDANSFFASVEKKFDDSHSLNFTGFYTPNERGKNSPNTQEVYELKGHRYNSYWGWQNGEIRNSRIKVVEEPVLMLNYYWKPSKDLEISSSVAYHFGKTGNSRIDYGGSRLYEADSQTIFMGGGSNPDPAYYQNLPSYYLRSENSPDFRGAYLAEQDFRDNGQLNWEELYRANEVAATLGGNAIYALYEDRTDDRQLTAGSNFRYTVSSHAVVSGALNFRQLRSENFASVLDLFGAASFLDVDSFSEGTQAQNDLQNQNNLVAENDIFKYHYGINATSGGGFLQAEFRFKRIEAYFAGQGSAISYQRTGYFQNGNFPDNSLGESDPVNFGNYGAKAGFTYKITGRHYLTTNLTGFTKPPSLRNSFSNARQNNDIVFGLENEKIFTADAGYTIRAPFLTGRITGFYGTFEDATEVSFYYADGLSGSGREVTNAFVQEIMTGMDKRHIGLEFGLEIPLTSTLKLRTAGSVGEYIFNSDPEVYLTSDDFTEVRHMGKAALKDYRLSGGPQQAIQAGFEYRDPDYWWISASANFFSKTFIDVAPLPRTRNFKSDVDGFPFVHYDESIAQSLLRQEEFESYMLVNIVGGKSWRLKNRFVGFFGSLNNILDSTYKTGGYEQSRNVNYALLKADMERVQPVFGSKYWFGPGTTYYAHVYYRF